LVDDSLLQSDAEVLGYRQSPAMRDLADCPGALFGSTVRGVVLTDAAGATWLLVTQGRFLPMAVKGKVVVRPLKDLEAPSPSSRSQIAQLIGPQNESALDWKCERCSEMNLKNNEDCWLCKAERPQADHLRHSKLIEVEAELKRVLRAAEHDKNELARVVKAGEHDKAEIIRLMSALEADTAERQQLLLRVEALENAKRVMETQHANQVRLIDDHGRQFLGGIEELEKQRDQLRFEVKSLKEAEVDAKSLQGLELANKELRSGTEARDHQISHLLEEREVIEELMSGEGLELRERIEQLTQDKERLNEKMAHTLAKVEASSGQNPELEHRFDVLSREKESLKDELVLVQGQVVLLENKLAIAERKLKLADTEILMLQNERVGGVVSIRQIG